MLIRIMKKVLIATASIIITAFAGCNYANNNPEPHIPLTADSVNINAIDSNSLIVPSTVILRPDNTYVDLITGIKVKVTIDSISRDIINEVTGQPVIFLVDPLRNDTFDRKGRRVNNALIRENDSLWKIDESKVKLK